MKTQKKAKIIVIVAAVLMQSNGALACCSKAGFMKVFSFVAIGSGLYLASKSLENIKDLPPCNANFDLRDCCHYFEFEREVVDCNATSAGCHNTARCVSESGHLTVPNDNIERQLQAYKYAFFASLCLLTGGYTGIKYIAMSVSSCLSNPYFKMGKDSVTAEMTGV